jgi:hypothetical protein
VDGRVVDALVTDNEAVAKKWLTSPDTLVSAARRSSIRTASMHVRISAHVRPQRHLLGWANGVTNPGKVYVYCIGGSKEQDPPYVRRPGLVL